MPNYSNKLILVIPFQRDGAWCNVLHIQFLEAWKMIQEVRETSQSSIIPKSIWILPQNDSSSRFQS